MVLQLFVMKRKALVKLFGCGHGRDDGNLKDEDQISYLCM